MFETKLFIFWNFFVIKIRVKTTVLKEFALKIFVVKVWYRKNRVILGLSKERHLAQTTFSKKYFTCLYFSKRPNYIIYKCFIKY